MLRLLTDSHVPPAVAKTARRLASLDVTALRDWHGGLHLNAPDELLLELAWVERVTLVTYDVNTFPLTVKERLEAGRAHAGVIYVSARFRQNDVGGIARGLIKPWRAESNLDWTDRIRFLE